MRHGKLFDRNFALLQSTTNLLFIGAFQPQLNRFFDHRFRVFRCFSLADDAQLGTVCNIPTVLPRFDNSGELGKFHAQEGTLFSTLCQFCQRRMAATPGCRRIAKSNVGIGRLARLTLAGMSLLPTVSDTSAGKIRFGITTAEQRIFT